MKLNKEVENVRGNSSDKIAKSEKTEAEMKRELDAIQKANKALKEKVGQVCHLRVS